MKGHLFNKVADTFVVVPLDFFSQKATEEFGVKVVGVLAEAYWIVEFEKTELFLIRCSEISVGLIFGNRITPER